MWSHSCTLELWYSGRVMSSQHTGPSLVGAERHLAAGAAHFLSAASASKPSCAPAQQPFHCCQTLSSRPYNAIAARISASCVPQLSCWLCRASPSFHLPFSPRQTVFPWKYVRNQPCHCSCKKAVGSLSSFDGHLRFGVSRIVVYCHLRLGWDCPLRVCVRRRGQGCSEY